MCILYAATRDCAGCNATRRICIETGVTEHLHKPSFGQEPGYVRVTVRELLELASQQSLNLAPFAHCARAKLWARSPMFLPLLRACAFSVILAESIPSSVRLDLTNSATIDVTGTSTVALTGPATSFFFVWRKFVHSENRSDFPNVQNLIASDGSN